MSFLPPSPPTASSRPVRLQSSVPRPRPSVLWPRTDPHRAPRTVLVRRTISPHPASPAYFRVPSYLYIVLHTISRVVQHSVQHSVQLLRTSLSPPSQKWPCALTHPKGQSTRLAFVRVHILVGHVAAKRTLWPFLVAEASASALVGSTKCSSPFSVVPFSMKTSGWPAHSGIRPEQIISRPGAPLCGLAMRVS